MKVYEETSRIISGYAICEDHPIGAQALKVMKAFHNKTAQQLIIWIKGPQVVISENDRCMIMSYSGTQDPLFLVLETTRRHLHLMTERKENAEQARKNSTLD